MECRLYSRKSDGESEDETEQWTEVVSAFRRKLESGWSVDQQGFGDGDIIQIYWKKGIQGITDKTRENPTGMRD